MQWVLAASAPLAMWVCMAIGSSRVSWRIDSHVARGSARAAPACGEEDRDENSDPEERSGSYIYAQIKPICQLLVEGKLRWGTIAENFFPFFSEKHGWGREMRNYGRCSNLSVLCFAMYFSVTIQSAPLLSALLFLKNEQKGELHNCFPGL